jgi:hypothetical protein
MAFYNEVKPGDVFQPSANLHNDTIRLINKMNGISEATSKGKGNGATVLKVYNPTDVDFAPGTPVNFDNDQAIVEEHVPIKSYSDEQAPWGVLKDGLQAGCFGSCIVSGPVTISLSGEGKYAVPSESGFDTTDKPVGNSALILYSNGVNATICLGSASPVQEEVEKEEDCYVCKVISTGIDGDPLTPAIVEVILGPKTGTVLNVFATTISHMVKYPEPGSVILVHRVASKAIEFDDEMIEDISFYPEVL